MAGYVGRETNSNGEMMLGAIKEAKLEILPINGVTFMGRNGSATCIDYIAISRNLRGR